jgi:CspA family cold shock protein
MATGTVKFFNTTKGFGFIEQEGGGPDVFVHISAVERAGLPNLVDGQKVSFDIETDSRSGKSAATNRQRAKPRRLKKAPGFPRGRVHDSCGE